MVNIGAIIGILIAVVGLIWVFGWVGSKIGNYFDLPIKLEPRSEGGEGTSGTRESGGDTSSGERDPAFEPDISEGSGGGDDDDEG